MRYDITTRLERYSKYIKNYDEITSEVIAKKRGILHVAIATQDFTGEIKEAFEAFGVAEELSRIISNTISNINPSSTSRKRQHNQIEPKTSAIAEGVTSSYKKVKPRTDESERQSHDLKRQALPLLLSSNNNVKIPKTPEEYSITQGSYKQFKASEEATLVFTRSKPGNKGIHQLILSKSISVFTIKIALEQDKNFHKWVDEYRNELKLENLKNADKKIDIFKLNAENCLQSCPLEQDHFILLLGKLSVPDEITVKLTEITRTFSGYYNRSQTPIDELSQQTDSTTMLLQKNSTVM